MSLLAQTLLDDARLQAYPHLREETISPAALLRHLTSLDREIVGLFMVHVPERISVAGTDVPIVLATNPTGYTLSAAKAYTEFRYVDKDGIEYPIEIPPEGKWPSRHPAARVRGATFFPIDRFDRDWDSAFGDRTFFRGDGDLVEYRYIPEPVRVTTMAAVLASPDEAESYIREALTLHILLMSEDGVPAERLQAANTSMLLKRQMLLHEITKRVGVSARFGE